MRFGLVSNSFGRLIDLVHFSLCLSTFGRAKIANMLNLQDDNILNHTRTWYFANSDKYIGLLALLESTEKLTSSKFVHSLYRVFSKFQSTQKMLVSQDELANLGLQLQKMGLVPLESKSPWAIKSTIPSDKVLQFQKYMPSFLNEKKIVLIHVRDDFWFDKSFAQDGSIGRQTAFRNSKFSDFQPLIFHLISKGYTVVRVGRGLPAHVASRDYWDYAGSELASDETDFSLWESATFAISTGGGADQLRILFGTPTIFLNFSEDPICQDRGQHFNQKTVVLPKGYCSQSNLRFLKYNELVQELGFFTPAIVTEDLLSTLRIKLIENSPASLIETVDAFELYLRSGADFGFFKSVKGVKIASSWKNID